MFSFRRPTPEALRRVLTTQTQLGFTYREVGATAKAVDPVPGEKKREGAGLTPSPFQLPPSYTIDHIRVELGMGDSVFRRAVAALKRWEQFHLGWLEAFPNDTPIRAGEAVLVIARAGGLWWTNAARIVYTIDDTTEQATRFGFAYGTLPGHVECGEERFLIEWDQATGKVLFDIVAFSRPRHFLVRVNRRRARAMQKRFALESTAAMQRAVLNET
jgi:uncharacterized protein (UPF0548 family)